MTIPSSSAGGIMGVASRASSTPSHVTYLRRCRLNLVDVLFQGVRNFGRVLFALAIGPNMAAWIPSVADLAGRLMYWRLVLQTLFRRSL